MGCIRLDRVLAGLARLGLVDGPSPVEALPGVADRLGLASLFLKRDDQLPALAGGTKLRKLDALLAAPPFSEAERWVAYGALGSGHVSTLALAARAERRPLEVHLFDQPLSERVLEDLACTVSWASRVHYHPSRLRLGLRHPLLLTRGGPQGTAVIPAGGTTVVSMMGLVRAALELARQVDAGLVPRPDRVVLPLGTAGTAVGLLCGFQIAGLSPRIHAVAAVERWFSTPGRLRRLTLALRAHLAALGLAVPEREPQPELRVDRSELGARYGAPTPASLEAAQSMRARGVPLEPVYSGKAFAALEHAENPREHVLFWVTPRRLDPLPTVEDWRERLPRALAARLEAPRPRRVTRRRVLAVTAGTALAVGLLRTTGYPEWPGWQGQSLSEWQAHVLYACARALLPPAPDLGAYREVAVRVDRFLAGLTPALRDEIDLLFTALEHGTTPLAGHWSRLSALEPAEVRTFLATLGARGGLQRQMAKGVRDLVMLGYYQQPETWAALGYEGPWVLARREREPRYAALCAPPGVLPRGLSSP